MWRWWYGIRDMKKLQEEGLSAYIRVKKEYMILKETKLCTFFVIRYAVAGVAVVAILSVYNGRKYAVVGK